MSRSLLERASHSHRRIQTLFGALGALGIYGGAAAHLWPDRRAMLVVMALYLALCPINWWATERLPVWRGQAWAERIRAVFNVAAIGLLGHLADWPLPVLMFIPFTAVLVPTISAVGGGTMAVSVFGAGAMAVLDGKSFAEVFPFVAIGVFAYAVTLGFRRLADELLRARERDLEELSRAHEQLKAAQQAALLNERLASIGLLAAGVAHEINNPMSYVTANVTDLLAALEESGAALPPSLMEYRDEVLPDTVDGIRRVNAIVSDLRQFARGEPQNVERFDLTREVEAAVRIARAQARGGEELRTNCAPVEINGMPRQVGQVALNLIINALHALNGHGVVTISTERAGDMAVLTVEDNGAGMSQEVRARLFEPFFTTKAGARGTGLGLSVVHGIVTAHGGTIEVESSPGQGARFTVRVPAAVAASQRAA